MESTTTRDERETHGEVLMTAMLGTALLVAGLVAVMAIVGGWLLMGMTVGALLIAGGVVVLVVLRLLDESGDPRPAEPDAVEAPAVGVTAVSPARAPRSPAVAPV